MRSIELFVILAVAALNFTVVPGGKGTNELVADPQIGQGFLKQRGALRPYDPAFRQKNANGKA